MKAAIVAVCLALLPAWPASAQTATPTPAYSMENAVTNQGVSVPGQPCATSTVMQAGTWYLVSEGMACQPCLEATGKAPSYCPAPAAPTKGICDPNPTNFWIESVHGHVTFGPPSQGTAATAVRVQQYLGLSRDETFLCNANSGQVTCPFYTLAWDWIWDVPSSTNSVEVPFDLNGGASTFYQTPGDGDPARFYVFAMPIGGSLMCTSNQYVTEEVDSEY
jgi:hypothetical protein